MEFESQDDNPKHTAEEIRAASLSLVAHALKMMAASPNDPKVMELAGRIMQSDPTMRLDAVESSKNLIEF